MSGLSTSLAATSVDAGEPLPAGGDLDVRDPGEPGRAGVQGTVGGRAERGEQAGAAVRGAAAAQPDHDPAGPGSDGGEQQLPDPDGVVDSSGRSPRVRCRPQAWALST